MVSEASAPRFVVRSRASPDSECEKIQFHIQREEPETAMLTVDSRVFDVCTPKVMRVIKNGCEGIVVGCQPGLGSYLEAIVSPSMFNVISSSVYY
jgi:hypothetical protein